MKVLIHDITQEREAWIKSKQYHIGSGDIATIVGANRFCTPLKLWARKLGKEPREEENEHMWWGNQMERPIAELCARRLGMKVEYGNTLFCHDELDWAVATPDYFASGEVQPPNGTIDPLIESLKSAKRVIFECKNVGYHMKREWDFATPLSPRIQVMWQLGVTGLDRGIVAPLIGGDIDEFSPRWVEFDANIFGQLVELAEKFIWHLGNDTPPAAQADDSRIVERIVGDIQDKTVELEEDSYEALTQYLELKKAESAANKAAKEAKDQADALKNNMLLKIGGAKKAVCKGLTGEIVCSCTKVEQPERTQKAYSYVLFKAKKLNENE